MTTTTEPTTAHRETLERALTAIRERTYWSAYPENLKAYGEESGTQSAAEGKAAFDGYLGKPFPLQQSGTDGEVAGERSPYGLDLAITYPHADVGRAARRRHRRHPGLARRRARRPRRRSPWRSCRASTPAATRWRRRSCTPPARPS